MKPEVELKNVTVGYLTETVIRNLYLAIMKGDLVGIFGPNGAGKTTLLCAVNGLAVQTGGSVLIRGKELTKLSGIKLRKSIGFVPQHFDIDPRLPISAREVVLMGRYGKMGLFRFAGRTECRLIEELSTMLGISHVIHKPFGQLSGGEKKRVLIARALIKEPTIMLLDEIFAWLDKEMQEKLLGIIKRIHHDWRLTTLIVSHDLKMIENICETVIWMQKGEVVFNGRKSEFLEAVNE